MSYCKLITFENGKPKGSIEYRNSWGGAAFIWDALFQKYLKDPEKEYDNFLAHCMNGDTSLWDLAKREDIPLFMRAVHASTFDRAIVRREHFTEFANHLDEFTRYFGYGDKVCHLNAWANYIRTCQAEAIGFYGTSVGENLWFDYDEEKEESIPYDLNERDAHIEVYDWLSEIDNSQAGPLEPPR